MSADTLLELVTRLLYRLRFMSEQRVFDNVSLSYILPLVTLVLQNRGIGLSDCDDANEQVTLALEFLAFHTDSCRLIEAICSDGLTSAYCLLLSSFG